jgi:hypothetical protein
MPGQHGSVDRRALPRQEGAAAARTLAPHTTPRSTPKGWRPRPAAPQPAPRCLRPCAGCAACRPRGGCRRRRACAGEGGRGSVPHAHTATPATRARALCFTRCAQAQKGFTRPSTAAALPAHPGQPPVQARACCPPAAGSSCTPAPPRRACQLGAGPAAWLAGVGGHSCLLASTPARAWINPTAAAVAGQAGAAQARHLVGKEGWGGRRCPPSQPPSVVGRPAPTAGGEAGAACRGA